MRSMRRNVDFGYLDRENPRKLLSDMAGLRTFRMRTNAGLQSVLCSCFIFKSNKDVFCEKVLIFVSAASSLLNCLCLSVTHIHITFVARLLTVHFLFVDYFFLFWKSSLH